MKLGRVRTVHFVGIGGSGMSGIAEVLLNLGYTVTGSDLSSTDVTERLAALGATVHEGHDAEAVAGADVVVVSSAVSANNPEVVEATRQRIPVIPRAEMLGELMRMKHSVAVAGSHGKTSVTAMLALVLARCGLDPTIVIGGRLGVLGSNAKLGRSDLMVAEADESDGSFLRLYPTLAVVTGIDEEHLDHYGSVEAVHDSFVAFLGKVPFHGAVVACLDDEGVQEILPRLDRRVVTYGLTTQAGFRASDIVIDGFTSRFTLRHDGEDPIAVQMRTPGRHQVQNALAALAVASELGLSLRVAATALEEFPGADRRMQQVGDVDGVLVVDDYGHHPTEVMATLSALRAAVGERRIVVLFQPHRFSRTQLLMDEFARAFYDADVLLVTDIYAASEEPRAGVTAEALAGAIAGHGHRDASYAGPLDDAIDAVMSRVEAGDVLLTLGAGSVGRAPARLVESLAARGANG